MKKYLYLLSFLAVLQLTGCKTPTIPRTEKEYHFSFDSLATNASITKNLAVEDRWLFQFAPVRTSRPDCDSVCDVALQELLARLNMEKVSGKNRYDVLYDKYRRQLEINVKLAATADTVSEHTRVSGKQDSKETVEPVIVEVIPWWVKILAWIGGLSIVYWAFRIGKIFI